MSDKDKTNTDDEDVLLQTAKSNSEEGESVEGISLDSDLLKNIPVTISVEVGRTSLQIKELMRLTQGSVVELDRLAGEPLDLLVSDTLVAKGEIVLVNDRYGMRLTQIVPKSERMKLL